VLASKPPGLPAAPPTPQNKNPAAPIAPPAKTPSGK
jgi:hypothetical protein